jgi:hypothetical protein
MISTVSVFPLAATSGGASVTVSDTAPEVPNVGDLWWKSDTGVLKVYYDDGSSTQWVDATPGGVLPTWKSDQHVISIQVFS